MRKKQLEKAILGGGCFWCLDAVYSRVKGVEEVVSGYSGGKTENPTYEEVSSGTTGHAEAVELLFDPEVLSYEEILQIFFSVHDPTTLNRQGNDIGLQYRSIILYDTQEQKAVAENFIQNLEREKIFSKPIVTEIKALKNFYPANTYHQKYFEKNPEQAYCQIIISPKIIKLKEKFKTYYKE